MPDLLSILGATPPKGGNSDIARLSGAITPLKSDVFSSVLLSLAEGEQTVAANVSAVIHEADAGDDAAAEESLEGEDADCECPPLDAETNQAENQQPAGEDLFGLTEAEEGEVDAVGADEPRDDVADHRPRATLEADKPPAWHFGTHPIESAVRGALFMTAASVDRKSMSDVRVGAIMANTGAGTSAHVDRTGPPESGLSVAKAGATPTMASPGAADQIVSAEPVANSAAREASSKENRAFSAGSPVATPVVNDTENAGALRAEAKPAEPVSAKPAVIGQEKPAPGPAAPVPPDRVMQPTSSASRSPAGTSDPGAVSTNRPSEPSAPAQQAGPATALPPSGRTDMPSPAMPREPSPQSSRSPRAGIESAEPRTAREETATAPAPLSRTAATAGQQPSQPVQNPAVFDAATTLSNTEARVEPSAVQTVDTVSRTFESAPGQPMVAARPEVARDIGRQLAPSIMAAADGSVDIALSPKELGHVRMSLSVTDTGVTLLVSAERPETIELMRRHSSELSAALREMGYENIAFSFGTGGDAGSAGGAQDQNQTGAAVTSEGGDSDPMPNGGAAEPASSGRIAPDGSLDIRI
ncbi:Flagellar hook-length control protein FliK [Marinibacterium anthonyi]|nr:Flagellar hook-length control protein FliK [Marinibacterium anthonyi]